MEALGGKTTFSLYVSIPFCPTRCAYCSFVSQDMEHAKKLMDPYFQLLLEEIEKVAQVTKDLGSLWCRCTSAGARPPPSAPSSLSALCGKIRQVFDFSRCGEFTVEAGRPDTITQEKLLALREADISRISINPQSLSDRCCATSAAATPPKTWWRPSAWPSAWAFPTSTPT